MAKQCYECVIKNKVNEYSHHDSAHYCGFCGQNIEGEKHEWKVYNPSSAFLLAHGCFLGVFFILFAFTCFVWLAIELCFAELVGQIAPYKQGIFVKIFWSIGTCFLMLLSVFMIGVGYAMCRGSKDEKYD